MAAVATMVSAAAQYQLPNPGFEEWDGGTTSEPTHWNSFASADGTFSSLASSPHHYRRNGGRPGTEGSYYLTIYSTSIIGIVANGNMTTGRIHAGSMSAADEENYNYTQRSNASHCQPFTGTPDSLYVWVSFYAASVDSKAQVSAIIHGDNDFKSPNHEEDVDRYCGKAIGRFSRTSDSPSQPQWTLVQIPFEYSGNSAPRYLLLSLASNAVPGSGSGNDSLSIDDIQFVYSAWLTGVSIDGHAVKYFRKNKLDYTVHVDDPALLNPTVITATTEVDDATVVTAVEPLDDTSSRVTLTVTAEDSVTVHTYTLTLTTGNPEGAFPLAIHPADPSAAFSLFPNPASDLIHLEGLADGTLVALYDLSGRLLTDFGVHNAHSDIYIGNLTPGTYLLRCGNTTRRFIKN